MIVESATPCPSATPWEQRRPASELLLWPGKSQLCPLGHALFLHWHSRSLVLVQSGKTEWEAPSQWPEDGPWAVRTVNSHLYEEWATDCLSSLENPGMTHSAACHDNWAWKFSKGRITTSTKDLASWHFVLHCLLVQLQTHFETPFSFIHLLIHLVQNESSAGEDGGES